MTTFTSTTDGNINDGGTYGNTSPGVAGTDFPDSDDICVAGGSTTITLNVDYEVRALKITGTIAGGGNTITVNGATSNKPFDNDGTITGDLNVTITNTGIQQDGLLLDAMGTSGNINNLTLNLANGTTANKTVGIASSTTLDNTLTITSGTFNTVFDGGASQGLSVGGHIFGNGTFVANDSTVTVAGQCAPANVELTAGSITSNDDFRPTTQTTIDGNGSITAAGGAQMGGLFDIGATNTPTLQAGRLHSSLDIPTGNQGQSTFNLALNEDQTGPSRHLYFYNFTLDSEGTENNTLTLAASFTVTNNLTITDGELKCNGATVEVQGKTTIGNASHSSEDKATITCDASAMFLGSGKTDDYAIEMLAGGTYVGGNGNHTTGAIKQTVANTKFTFTSATTTINSENTSDDRMFELTNGQANNADGRITFTGNFTSCIQWTGPSGDTGPHNVRLNDTNLTLKPRNTLNVEGYMNIDAGTFNTQYDGSDKTLTVTGDIEIADGGPKLIYNASTVTCARLGVGLGGVGAIDGTEAGKIIVNGTGNVRILDLAGAVLTGDTVTFEYQGQATTATQALSGLTSGVFNLIVNSDGATEKCIPNASVTSLNDLTMTDGEFELPSSTNIEADGDLIISANGVADLNPASSDGNVTFRSVVISSGGTLEAPSHGSFTLTGTLSAWSFQNNSTNFNHNNGTITQTAAGHIKSVSTNPFYNFTLNSSSSDSHEAVFRASSGTDVVLTENNLALTRGIVKVNTGSDTMAIGSIDIAGTGTLQASSTTTTITKGNFNNSGTFTHNDGMVKFNHATNTQNMQSGGSVVPVFYKLDNGQPAVGGGTVVVWKSITVVHTLSQTGGRYFQFKGDQGSLTVTLGSSAIACTVTEGNRCLATLSGAGPVNIYGADQLKPWVITTGGPNHACTEVHYKWGDYSADTFNTQHNITIDGDMKFGAFNVNAGDELDLNTQRVEFTGAFDLNSSTSALKMNDAMAVFTNTIDFNGRVPTSNTGTTIIHNPPSASEKLITSLYFGGTFFAQGAESEVNGYAWGGSSGEYPAKIFVGGMLDCQQSVTTGHWQVAAPTSDADVGGELRGNDRVLTAEGDFTTSGGLIGKSALDFNAASNPYVDLENNAAWQFGTNNFTLEAWFRSDTNTGLNRTIIANGDASDNGFLLYMQGGGNIKFFINNIAVANAVGPYENDDTWHHVAAVRDGNDYLLYIDGKLMDKSTQSAQNLTHAGKASIGARDLSASVDAFFDGQIAMVRVFKGASGGARTQSEIRADMFNDSANLADSTDLMCAYDFNEGSGTSLDNIQGNTNFDGTITNATWVGGGTFTYGTSTLKMTGTNKNINFTGDIGVYKLTVATGGDTNAITVNEINGNNGGIVAYHTLEVESGKLTSTTNEYIQIGRTFGNVLVAAGKGATALADLARISLYQNGQSGTANFPSASSGDKNITLKRFFINSDSSIEVLSQGNLTITTEIKLAYNNTFNFNGNTLSPIKVTLENTSGLTLGAATLDFPETGGLYSVAGCVLSAGPGATITGHTTRALFESQNDWQVVGKIENLNVTEQELKVTGQVINCTGDIHQYFPTIDHAQQLDADTADDRDVRLGRDMDANTELINS